MERAHAKNTNRKNNQQLFLLSSLNFGVKFSIFLLSTDYNTHAACFKTLKVLKNKTGINYIPEYRPPSPFTVLNIHIHKINIGINEVILDLLFAVMIFTIFTYI